MRDLGGHYYTYASCVLPAAERAGFQPVLVMPREFRDLPALPQSWQSYPVFRNKSYLQEDSAHEVERIPDHHIHLYCTTRELTAQYEYLDVSVRRMDGDIERAWLSKQITVQTNHVSFEAAMPASTKRASNLVILSVTPNDSCPLDDP